MKIVSLLFDLHQRFPRGGYFLEAGAHDGVGDSQTRALEQTGWRGLCVEPSLAYELLVKARTCRTDHRALWNSCGRAVFRELPRDVELSGLLGGFKPDGWDRTSRSHFDRLVETVTLPILLAEHGAPALIEFFSLDTEGSELEILQAHDFDRYRFEVLLVEHNGVDGKRGALRDFMRQKGYDLSDEDEKEDLYTWSEPVG